MTTRLSVIIPFLNESEHLPALINGLSKQETGSCEFLFVDDHSNDNSCEIVRLLGREEKLPLRLLSNEGRGLGAARNTGMAYAQGDFIAFLDSDDAVDVSGLMSLTKRMDECSGDLAVFNHERKYPDGQRKINVKTSLLSDMAPIVELTKERLCLLDNFNVSWNKVYRKSFVDDCCLSFYDGAYEDIPWSVMSVVRADRIVVTPEVFYTYNCREGSVLGTSGFIHVDVMVQYRRLLQDLKELPGVPSIVMKKVAAKGVTHALFVAYKTSRLDFAGRALLFKRLKNFLKTIPDGSLNLLSMNRTERLSFKIGSRIPLEIRRLKKNIRSR